MRIVLLGPPGAGKGTLATALKESLGLLHISTGDILREEMKNNTELGKEAKTYVESGGLVPDELVTRLIKNRLENDPSAKKGFLMDGFPRTLTQAKDLDSILETIGMPVECTLCLEASLDIVVQRLTGRRVCKSCGALYHIKNMPSQKEGICDKCGGVLYQRTDDNEETISNRMKVYTESTKPIIEYYKDQGKLKVLNADKEAQEVKEVALKNLNG